MIYKGFYITPTVENIKAIDIITNPHKYDRLQDISESSMNT